MKCEQCGFENAPGVLTCSRCGAASATGSSSPLSQAELERIRHYLPPRLAESLHSAGDSPSPAVLQPVVDHLSALYHSLAAHLPAYIRQSLREEPAPGRPSGQFVRGALAFADVSGFTAMSEKLSRIGREGAEEITAIINRYFGAMLDILHEHDGQLINFGGDALLGLFADPGGALRATQAALRMQAAMAEFSQIQTSQGVFPLQMKVGIHAGQFFAAQLGNLNQMTYALFGADVNATAASESAAVAGQVLLDQAMYDGLHLAGLVTGRPHTEGYYVVDQVQPLQAPAAGEAGEPAAAATLAAARQLLIWLETLTPYLPLGLLARVASDPAARSLEGEHRRVAVLFANVHGLGDISDRLGPGQAGRVVEALNRYFTAMEAVLNSFGGVANKIDLYDHGDKLLAFFGAPVAHEDDAERAVRAARAMQAALADVNADLPGITGLPDARLRQQIGISYGYVFAGYVGTDWRREYTVMGDSVNLAARLMTVAQSDPASGQSIIIPPQVERKTQALFELTPRGEVRLKGKSQPVPIFSVGEPRAAPEAGLGWQGVRSPLVGRQQEWQTLLGILQELLEGRGRIVSVVAEAGLGKSRLVEDMRRSLLEMSDAESQLNRRWYEGRCMSFTESVSFLPFQEIVRGLVGAARDEDKPQTSGKLRAVVERLLPAESVPETLPYLANFLTLPLDEAMQEKVRYLDAEALQRRTFIAIRALIEAEIMTVQAPLVLVLEDIHWLDQASRALLEYLLPLVARQPVLVLMLYRPERDKICWQIRERVARDFEPHSLEVSLSALDAADSRELLVNLAQTTHWPSAMVDQMLERTDGNPLYMEELIRSLISVGALFQDESGQWHLRSQGALEVPDSLQGMLMARLDRLDEPPRRTAQVASVVGRQFAFDMLAYIREQREPEQQLQLTENLGQLEQSEIVYLKRRAPDSVYAFKHGLMQEVYYASLLARTSRQFHRRIAEYLETRLPPDELESEIALVAHHAFVGQEWERALRFQVLAGQQSKKLFANQDALDHFTKALQCAENVPGQAPAERLAIHLALGEMLTASGQYEQAQAHLNQALELAQLRGEAESEARACRWLARGYELRGEYPPALEWIDRGLSRLAGQELAVAAELFILAAQIHIRQGENAVALEKSRKALDIAERAGEVTALARGYQLMGHLMYRSGNPSEAMQYFQQSLDLNRRAGDLYGQGTAQNFMANVYFNTGRWTEADQYYRQARQILAQIGNVYVCAVIDNNRGGIAKNQGRLDDALQLFRDGLQAFEQIGGSLYVLGMLQMNLGSTFIRRGDVAAARQHLAAGQSYFEQAQVRESLSELYRYMAEAELLAKDLPLAEAHGQQALSLAREIASPSDEGTSLRVLGETSMAQARPAEAETRFSQSVSILKDAGEEYEAARSQLGLAHALSALSDAERAQQALAECLPVFERLEAALDLADAHALSEALGGA